MKDMKLSTVIYIFISSILFVTRLYLQLDDPLTPIEYLLNVVPLLYDGWSSHQGGSFIYAIICFGQQKTNHQYSVVGRFYKRTAIKIVIKIVNI